MGIKKVFSEHHRNGYAFDQREGKWYSWEIDFYENGRRIRERGFLTRDEAKDAIASRRVKAKQRRHGVEEIAKEITLRELFDRRVELIESPNERTRARRCFDLLLELLPDGFLVTELKTPQLQKYVDQRRQDTSNKTKKRITPAAIRRDMNTIGAALHKAGEMFPELESWSPPKIPRPKLSRRRRERLITPEEQEQVLSWLLEPDLREKEKEEGRRTRRLIGQAFCFQLLTGLRRKEIFALRWSDYDRENKSLKVVRWKTDATTYFSPLPAVVIDLIEERCAVSTNEFIFSNDGRAPNTIYRVMKKACAETGIPYGEAVAGGFTMHDARHTFTTRLLQAGTDLATAQSFTGHDDKTMVMIYGHASPESRKRAMDALYGAPRRDLKKLFSELYRRARKGKISEQEFVEILEKELSGF